MKKPKKMQQVYQEYLKKSANFRRAENVPPCCGTCHFFVTEPGTVPQCCVGDDEEDELNVSPDNVCDFYRRFDNPPKNWEDNFENPEEDDE